MLMITFEEVQRNLPKAVQWVTQKEQDCMEMGQPLLPQNRQDGETIGIRELAAVRVMVLNEIPLPSDPELRQLAAQSKLITPTTAGMTFGHGIVLKAGHYNRHLIAHELGHVLQYERFGELNRGGLPTRGRFPSLLSEWATGAGGRAVGQYRVPLSGLIRQRVQLREDNENSGPFFDSRVRARVKCGWLVH